MDPITIGLGVAGLIVAVAGLWYTRRGTNNQLEQSNSESFRRLKAREEEGRQRAEDARRLREQKEAKPDWPEVIAPGIGLDRNVVGREGDVATLRATLTGKGAAAITPGNSDTGSTQKDGAVIKARGGMGKTTLARFYIQTHKQSYFGIWWLRAQARSTVIEDLNALASVLQIGSVEDAPDARAKAALVHLQAQKEPWLLVYDNAERMADLREVLPDGEHLHILLTSREGNWPARFAEQPADALPEGEAIALLYQESGRVPDDADGAKALVRALDHLPLAIVAAGAWLRDVSEGFAEYQEKLAERITEKPESLSDYPDSVFGAIKLSLDKLSDDAALLMKVFCWLSPDELWPGLVTGIPKSAVPNPQEFWDDIPEVLMDLARDGAAVDRAFAELKARSLMDREGEDHWKLHRLTQAVQQGLLRGGTERAAGLAEEAARFSQRGASYGEIPAVAGMTTTNEARHSREGGNLPASSVDHLTADDWGAIAAAMLAAGYPHDSDFRENWPICARLDAHVAALVSEPPATAAMDYLLNQASLYLDAQRMDDRALRFSLESLRLKELRLGEAHETVGIACNNLAGRYWRLGRMAEAEAMAARAVTIAEANGVGNPASYARRLSTHGVMAEMVGRGLTGDAQREKLELAEARYVQALEIAERLHGRQSREVATHLNNLANLHVWQGKWDLAIKGHGEALAIRRVVLADGDPLLATSLHNLGSTLLRSGRVQQKQAGQGVLELLEEALAIYEDAFDRVDHPDRVGTAGLLASAHLAMLGLAGGAAQAVTPAEAGVSEKTERDSRLRGNDGQLAGVSAGRQDDSRPGLRSGQALRGNDVEPSAERAAALCRSYELDLEQIKANVAEYIARARAHAAGEVILGENELQDSRAERISDKLAADWAPRAVYETLTGDLAPRNITDAYRAQEVLHGKWVASRGAIAGRKIALASKAMQEMVGIDHPVAGVIFANDVHETGAEISLSAFRHMGLEYELAFELARDVSAPVTAEEVLDLVARVRPAFELIEDKDADYGAIDVKTMIADNAWCGGIVLGEAIDGWRDLALGDLASVLSQAGVADEAGTTGAADPVNSLVWTLNHFTGRGAVVKAGEVVITGSVLRTRFPVAGDRFRYEISGHGAVEVSFVD